MMESFVSVIRLLCLLLGAPCYSQSTIEMRRNPAQEVNTVMGIGNAKIIYRLNETVRSILEEGQLIFLTDSRAWNLNITLFIEGNMTARDFPAGYVQFELDGKMIESSKQSEPLIKVQTVRNYYTYAVYPDPKPPYNRNMIDTLLEYKLDIKISPGSHSLKAALSNCGLTSPYNFTIHAPKVRPTNSWYNNLLDSSQNITNSISLESAWGTRSWFLVEKIGSFFVMYAGNYSFYPFTDLNIDSPWYCQCESCQGCSPGAEHQITPQEVDDISLKNSGFLILPEAGFFDESGSNALGEREEFRTLVGKVRISLGFDFNFYDPTVVILANERSRKELLLKIEMPEADNLLVNVTDNGIPILSASDFTLTVDQFYVPLPHVPLLDAGNHSLSVQVYDLDPVTGKPIRLLKQPYYWGRLDVDYIVTNGGILDIYAIGPMLPFRVRRKVRRSDGTSRIDGFVQATGEFFAFPAAELGLKAGDTIWVTSDPYFYEMDERDVLASSVNSHLWLHASQFQLKVYNPPSYPITEAQSLFVYLLGEAFIDPAAARMSDYPSIIPSDAPSVVPSDMPSSIPSDEPSTIPSDLPSAVPSDVPSTLPVVPSDSPSRFSS